MNEADVTKQIRLILPGPLRIKKNSKRPITIGGKNSKRRTIMIPGKPYQAWENEARKAAMMGLPFAFKPFVGPIEVTALIYYKGNKPDLSGCTESIGDCLEGIVWEDDGQIDSWDGSRRIHDKHNPRTEVVIRELGLRVGPLFQREG